MHLCCMVAQQVSGIHCGKPLKPETKNMWHGVHKARAVTGDRLRKGTAAHRRLILP